MATHSLSVRHVSQPNLLDVPLDTLTISQSQLNIDNKDRSNLFPWNGQFSPQLIERLIQAYADPQAFILDPFLGSGTVLYEAGRLGMAAFGSEINPAALKMAATYKLINVPPARRRRIIEEVSDFLSDLMPDAMPLFKGGTVSISGPLDDALVSQAAKLPDQHARTLLEALIVLLDIGNKPLDQRVLSNAWEKLKSIAAGLPYSEAPILVANCDARALPLPDAHVDCVITSPPYINVFNYHQQYRKSVESLGWDMLEVARSEIGSNRKHRGNRFLTVIQYCIDMADVFAEIRRVCKPDSRIIFVVGRESNVRKTVFHNAEIIARLAVHCGGLNFNSRQERVFQNRFGEMIYEDILHFIVGSAADRSPETPADIAKEVLSAALARAPEESRADLRTAIDRLADVGPSPIYCRRAAVAQLSTPRVV
jgi:SAM-dependent methyltransferase